jgi:quinol monooxygenase YgiN
MLAVVVSLHVKPDCGEEFLRLMTPVLDAMRHEASFINSVLHRDAEDPTRFMLYETWADRDDLVQVQMKRDYRRDYEARLPDLLREPRQAQMWERLRADFTFFAPAADEKIPYGLRSPNLA